MLNKSNLAQRFQQDRWYRFGQLSRKRKTWVIVKFLSKKLKIYWLLKLFAYYKILRHFKDLY